jgi:hypothetical protein
MRIILSLLLAVAAAGSAVGASNLLPNGSFDDKNDPLTSWKYKYDKEGESWYFTNHERVKVEPVMASRSGVLALWGDRGILFDTGQGTKVDSFPVQVKPGGRFKFSLVARSTGPGIRALVEGYQWRPGVKPHANPDISELRKCFKSEVMTFGSQQGGSRSGVGKNWELADVKFPAENPSPLAVEKLSKMEFLVVHLVAIDGNEGTLYIDDVKLEQISQ